MSFDKAKPAASTGLKASNPEILANWTAIEAALDAEHTFATSGTQDGKHTQGSARPFFQDSAPTTRIDGNAFTSADLGLLWIDSNSTPDNQFNILTATTPTWTPISTEIIAVMVAATHTWADVQTMASPVINTAISGTAVLDEDDLSSDSATQIATQQSIKAYIDTQIAAIGSLFGSWLSRSTDTSYLAATDGFVCAYSTTGTAHLEGFTDSSNPPTTKRLEDNPGGISGGGRCLTMPVKNGDYWQVDNADSIYWLPIGS